MLSSGNFNILRIALEVHGRLILSIQTRILHILSTWTATGYSTMHCFALYTVLTVITFTNYVADIIFALRLSL